jgi:hypothetical protein
MTTSLISSNFFFCFIFVDRITASNEEDGVAIVLEEVLQQIS